jgi:hypothetical protein
VKVSDFLKGRDVVDSKTRRRVGHGKLKVEPYISASKKRTPDSDEAAADGRKVATFKFGQILAG